MLPGGVLAKKAVKQIKNLSWDKHPHEMQKPIELKFLELNKKNSVKD